MTLLNLLQRVRGTERSAPLARLLAELDIQPFDTKSVEHYKAEKKEKTFLSILTTMPGSGSWQEIHTSTSRRFVSPSITDPAGLLLTEEVEMDAQARQQGWDLRFFHDRCRLTVPHAIFLRWRRMSIAEAVATIGVPEYIANKAAQILDKSPEAVLEVDALESKVRPYDPFLIVKQGEEEYYVEVWGDDEREFSH
jgi:hypothetical protein